MIIIIIIVITTIIIFMVWCQIQRQSTRKDYYSRASNHSKQSGKPLLVIGDPYNGRGSKIWGVVYGCGNVCLDITGCPKCPKGIKGKLEDVLPTLENNSYVIFVSYVLEYVDNIELIIRELKRVSGGDLYIAHVQPYDFLTLYFYKGTKRKILSAPPTHTNITYKPITPIWGITGD